jgi:dihydropyrimidine dehydrogenase (NAD+) subunit PreT
MPQSVSLSEVEHIAAMGVEFKLGVEITAEAETRPVGSVLFADLTSNFDAVFLAVGLGETNRLNVPGEDLDGVIDALAFIERIKTRDWKSIPLGRNVVVIGAGNTAIDAVTQAKRLGAEKVTLMYRRTEKDAPAYDYEMELARKDGVEFMWETTPVAIVGDGSVAGMQVRHGDREFTIDCDQVIKAIGQQKMRSFFADVARVETDEKGRVVVGDNMQTSDPKVFAGGDCANGGAEAVDASQMGKLAAMGIHRSLTGETVEFAGAVMRYPPKAPVDPNPH